MWHLILLRIIGQNFGGQNLRQQARFSALLSAEILSDQVYTNILLQEALVLSLDSASGELRSIQQENKLLEENVNTLKDNIAVLDEEKDILVNSISRVKEQQSVLKENNETLREETDRWVFCFLRSKCGSAQ